MMKVFTLLRYLYTYWRLKYDVRRYKNLILRNLDSDDIYELIYRFYDSISPKLACIFNILSSCRDLTLSINLLDSIADLFISDNDITNVINIPIILSIEFYTATLDYPNEYSGLFEKYRELLKDPNSVLYLANYTVESIDDSFDEALAVASDIYVYGLNAYALNDVESIYKVLNYYVMTYQMLDESNDLEYLMGIIIYGLTSVYYNLIRYRRKLYDDVVGRLYESIKSSKIIPACESDSDMDCICMFIRNALKKGDIYSLLRESVAINWFKEYIKAFNRRKVKMYKLENISLILNAAIKSLRRSMSSNLEYANEAFEYVSRRGILSESDKNMLVISTLKLYKIGFLKGIRNILSILENYAHREGREDLRHLTTLLKNIVGLN